MNIYRYLLTITPKPIEQYRPMKRHHNVSLEPTAAAVTTAAHIAIEPRETRIDVDHALTRHWFGAGLARGEPQPNSVKDDHAGGKARCFVNRVVLLAFRQQPAAAAARLKQPRKKQHARNSGPKKGSREWHIDEDRYERGNQHDKTQHELIPSRYLIIR